MDSIEYFETQIGRREVFGPAEANPEYKVIVDANNIIVEIDNEISSYMYMLSFFVQVQTAITALMFLDIVHKYVKDIYNKRFPEEHFRHCLTRRGVRRPKKGNSPSTLYASFCRCL